jgi:hypothetical protein
VRSGLLSLSRTLATMHTYILWTPMWAFSLVSSLLRALHTLLCSRLPNAATAFYIWDNLSSSFTAEALAAGAAECAAEARQCCTGVQAREVDADGFPVEIEHGGEGGAGGVGGRDGHPATDPDAPAYGTPQQQREGAGGEHETPLLPSRVERSDEAAADLEAGRGGSSSSSKRPDSLSTPKSAEEEEAGGGRNLQPAVACPPPAASSSSSSSSSSLSASTPSALAPMPAAGAPVRSPMAAMEYAPSAAPSLTKTVTVPTDDTPLEVEA